MGIANHHGRRRQLRDLCVRRLCLTVGRPYRCRGPSVVVEERRVDVVVHRVSVHAHLVIKQGEVRHVRPEGFGVGSVNIKEDAQLVLWTSGSQREGLVDTEDLRRLSPTRVWRCGEHLARRRWLACLGSAPPRRGRGSRIPGRVRRGGRRRRCCCWRCCWLGRT